MKNPNDDVQVIYEKCYTDDIGKNIPNFFSCNKANTFNVKSFWVGAIEGFCSSDCINYFSCLYGDLRLVIATDQGNNNYKFNQYFISGLDGKIIKVQPKLWVGIHNLSHTSSILINSTEGIESQCERLSPKIFNWHAKR